MMTVFAGRFWSVIRSRNVLAVGVIAGIVALAIRLLPLLPAVNLRGRWETPFPVVLLGVIVGLTYGLLAVGLVLIYRTNRIINFAHGEMGALAAAAFSLAVIRWHVPYWIAFLLSLVAAGGVGAIVEMGVVRRLRRAPRLMSVVATLGVAQFLVTFAFAINSTLGAGAEFPSPIGLPTFEVGPLLVTRAYSGMLLISPLVVIALIVFLKRSRFGLGILGAAANPDAARLSGIFASRMSSLAWAIAGALSAFTAILTQPTQGFAGESAFGPSLLLRALVGLVVARMTNLGIALVAGMALGVIEQLILWNYAQSGLVTAAMFVIILVGLLVQRPRGGREEEKGSWAAVQALRPIPDALKKMWIARNLGRVVAVIALALAIALSFLVSNANAITLTGIVAFTVVGLSVGVITGLGGQLTLGQFALAGVGGVTSLYVARKTGNFALAFTYAGIAGALASLVIGLPALRIKGLLLTVTTLSFALLVQSWLLAQPWMIGNSAEVVKVQAFGQTFDTGRSYYLFSLGVLLFVMWLARNVWRGGFGRILISIRDNEDNARAFTVPATAAKMNAFLLSGLIAGMGGALYVHSLTSITPTSFPADVSIAIVTMTVIGGVTLLGGPLLGVLLVIGVPAFLPLDSAALAATQLGLLLLILYVPGGLASLVEPVRDRLLGWFARRSAIDLDTRETTDEERSIEDVINTPEPTRLIRPLVARTRIVAGEVMLRAHDLRKNFGGVKAVDGVSLEIYGGETVGLIGPNGAGKTTTFELLAGFTRLDQGSVWFDGRDIEWMTPEQRGRLGLIRSFQDAALFPTMTVLEVVQLALERVAPTRIVASTLGLAGTERVKLARARDVISFMGLDQYRDKQIRELSTGTRRIAELACMVALEPTVLLLDEPSSGIAQRETEQLGTLLQELRRLFGITLFVIEHDIPLIMGLADRIIAMADGQVIAVGQPGTVRDDPKVIESYLGGTLAALEQSGSVSPRAVASAETLAPGVNA